MNSTTTAELIATAEQSLSRLQDACLALDLATARRTHRLARCRRLAGDARALLEEATDTAA